MTPQMVDTFITKIQNATNILLIMHNNPDGDAVGSACGLLELLNDNLQKTGTLIYSGKIPKSLNFIPHISNAVNIKDLDTAQIFDLAIAIDTGDISLLKDSTDSVFQSADYTVKIDHHKDSTNFADLNLHQVCSATGELIYKIALHANWHISQMTANSLYASIISDSGNFQFCQTSETLKIAAALIDLGAQPSYIAHQLSIADKASTLINAAAVLGTEFFFNNTMALATINKDQLQNLDCKGSVAMQLLRNIFGVDYVVLIKEHDDNVIHLSLRGNKPVNIIAHELGGAGHELAAGAILTGTLENARELVLIAFEKILNAPR